jgi:flagellar motor switch protein FliM
MSQLSSASKTAPAARTPFKPGTPAGDLTPTVIPASQLRRLNSHQEAFAAALAARFSLFLRAEFSVALVGIHVATYQRMTECWLEPSHLSLFKTEPLRGVAILQIPSPLGLSMVDRLMGGSGELVAGVHEFGAIENALIEQVAQMVTTEWCRHWTPLKELKPVLLGCESNARFLQTSPPQTPMLVIMFEIGTGGVCQQLQMGFPLATLEPLLTALAPAPAPEPVPPPPKPAVAAWNPAFNEVSVPVTGTWQGLKVAAREVLNLKVGDVLRLDPGTARQIIVRLGGNAKFQGRPGVVSGQWAVELTDFFKP